MDLIKIWILNFYVFFITKQKNVYLTSIDINLLKSYTVTLNFIRKYLDCIYSTSLYQL